MIRIYKRGPVWWAQSWFHGERKQWSLRTRDREVAEKLRRKAEMEILGVADPVPLAWREFHAEFLAWITPQVRSSSLRKYSFVLSRFSEYLAVSHVENLRGVTPAAIAAYGSERQRQKHPTRKIPVGAEGLKSDLRILHRVFAYAVDAGYLERNPVRQRGRNTSAGKTLPFTQDEIEKMLRDPLLNARPQLRAVVLTFLHTGLRISDVVALRRDALRDGRLALRARKNGRAIAVAVHPDLRVALDTHLRRLTETQKANPLLFSSATGQRLVSLDAILRRLWKRCGIEHGHAHRFRDTFAVRLLAHGATLYDVAKLLGIDTRTAERHYAPYVKELQERGARLVGQLDFVGSSALDTKEPRKAGARELQESRR